MTAHNDLSGVHEQACGVLFHLATNYDGMVSTSLFLFCGFTFSDVSLPRSSLSPFLFIVMMYGLIVCIQ